MQIDRGLSGCGVTQLGTEWEEVPPSACFCSHNHSYKGRFPQSQSRRLRGNVNQARLRHYHSHCPASVSVSMAGISLMGFTSASKRVGGWTSREVGGWHRHTCSGAEAKASAPGALVAVMWLC